MNGGTIDDQRHGTRKSNMRFHLYLQSGTEIYVNVDTIILSITEWTQISCMLWRYLSAYLRLFYTPQTYILAIILEGCRGRIQKKIIISHASEWTLLGIPAKVTHSTSTRCNHRTINLYFLFKQTPSGYFPVDQMTYILLTTEVMVK